MAIETFIYLFIGLGFFGVIGFWLYLEKKSPYTVRIKELVAGRKIIKKYKAGYYTDDSKVSWWKLNGEKDKVKRLIPVPPEDAIEISNKGKKMVDAYRFEDGTIVFIKDDWNAKTFNEEVYKNIPTEVQAKINEAKDAMAKKEILDVWKARVFAEWKKDGKVVAPLEPITTKQRMLYLNNIRKAEERKGTDWKTQLIPITSIAAMALVIICLMVFWGDIASPALQANEQAVTMAKINQENLLILKEIRTGQQTISDKLTDLNNKAPN